MQIEISEHAYELLLLEAQKGGTTPEALVEIFAEGVSDARLARNETEFYHALGFDDAEIAEVFAQVRQLPAMLSGGPISDQQFDEDK